TQADAVQWTSILGRIQTSLATSTLPSLPALTSPLQGSSPASLNQKQGFLYKQGGTVRNWKRRFFTLRRSILRYYENPTDLEPLGEIPLQNGSIDVADESLKRPFSWQISSRFRNYYLAADDDYEMASWMEALRSAMDNTPDDPKDQKRLQLYNLLSRILQQLESLSDPTLT
ncbi:MAG: hypothetical protein Q8P67_01045, partial [archaeon]|nr:hypothetical protein [archaeon]